jgi:glycine cleavage system regulatory protein
VLVKPGSLLFTDNGGQGKLTLENKTGKRMAIKMKCSDNNIYRISPVFALIDQEGNATVEITRSAGVPKAEKLAVVYVEVDVYIWLPSIDNSLFG